MRNISMLNKLADGNYGLIARNCAYIHCALSYLNASSHLSGEDILFLTGFIDMTSYLNAGQYTCDDLRTAVSIAHGGYITLDDHQNTHGPRVVIGFIGGDRALLTNFVMQVQTLIFAADNPSIASPSILNAVTAQKAVTQRNIDAAKADYSSGGLRMKEWDDVIMTVWDQRQWALSQ